MPDIIVSQSNRLIETSYRLSLNEQRLILRAISKIDGRKPIDKDNNFTVTADEFSETFGTPIKQTYEILNEAVSRLYERDIKTYDHSEKSRTRCRWVDSVQYWDGDAKVTLSFSRWVIPYLTLLYKQFTSYELKQISKMKTAHSIRFYELMMQFIKTGERHITMKKLRELLGLQELYTRFFDFKKRILIPSMADINETTDIRVEWDVVKKGSRITGLLFVFEKTD